MNLTTVAILRIEGPAILALAPLHPLRELAHGVAFLDVIPGLDCLQRKKHATAQGKGGGSNAPVMYTIDFRPDFRPGAGPDIQDTLCADFLRHGPH